MAAAVLRSHLPGNVLSEGTPMSGMVDDDVPAPTGDAIVAKGAKLELLFTRTAQIEGGLTEGPACAPDGSIYFSDIPFGKDKGMILRFDPKTKKTTVFKEDSGKSNGLKFDAKGHLIAVTDAGVRLDPVWLQALLRPLEQGSADVSCGFFAADPRSLFELALGCATVPLPSEINPERFLPSSRSIAFTRAAWQKAGGYPGWLDYCV